MRGVLVTIRGNSLTCSKEVTTAASLVPPIWDALMVDSGLAVRVTSCRTCRHVFYLNWQGDKRTIRDVQAHKLTHLVDHGRQGHGLRDVQHILQGVHLLEGEEMTTLIPSKSENIFSPSIYFMSAHHTELFHFLIIFEKTRLLE